MDNKNINAEPSAGGSEWKRTSSGTTAQSDARETSRRAGSVRRTKLVCDDPGLLSRNAGNRMDVESVRTWLSNAPQLNGERLNLNYLPSYAGWSLAVVKSAVKTDVLGGTRHALQLQLTRRSTVQNNADRLAVYEALEDLAAWAKENPPPGSRVRVAGLPEFTSRSAGGTEDVSITFTLSK